MINIQWHLETRAPRYTRLRYEPSTERFFALKYEKHLRYEQPGQRVDRLLTTQFPAPHASRIFPRLEKIDYEKEPENEEEVISTSEIKEVLGM